MLVFFDDILIYSNTWAKHHKHIKEVLGTLRSQEWYANKKKQFRKNANQAFDIRGGSGDG